MDCPARVSFFVTAFNLNNMKTINIDGVEYIAAKDLKEKAPNVKGLTYCIVRTYSAGVWAGYVDLKKVDKQMVVKDARRLWRWWSEFTLSALATTGMKEGKEKENKYAMPVDEVFLTEVIELIPCTKKSQEQIVNHPNYSE